MEIDLVHLAEEIAQRGIKKITGNIFIDDLIFDDVLWSRGNMWDDRTKGYAAPVAGLNVNYNRLQIKTVPGLGISKTAVPVLWPKTNFIDVSSEAKSKGTNTKLSFSLARGKERQEDWPTSITEGLRFGDKVIIKGQSAKILTVTTQLLRLTTQASLPPPSLKKNYSGWA